MVEHAFVASVVDSSWLRRPPKPCALLSLFVNKAALEAVVKSRGRTLPSRFKVMLVRGGSVHGLQTSKIIQNCSLVEEMLIIYDYLQEKAGICWQRFGGFLC